MKTRRKDICKKAIDLLKKENLENITGNFLHFLSIIIKF